MAEPYYQQGSSRSSSPVDDERRPLLYGQPYRPPPAPLSSEDIAQRRRSLGIDSALTPNGVSFISTGSAYSPEYPTAESHSASSEHFKSTEQHGQHDQGNCWDDSCVSEYCC
ncbi:hypothetical protein BX070DRAFT_233676 [Coemansia spiralis]|nr:hypothetical protein BX070DRAFT_233676 [Coemansia spiralis]